MTQEQVAAKAKISREYVSMLERDEYRVTIDVLLRVCRALDTEAWRIVKAVEQRRP